MIDICRKLAVLLPLAATVHCIVHVPDTHEPYTFACAFDADCLHNHRCINRQCMELCGIAINPCTTETADCGPCAGTTTCGGSGDVGQCGDGPVRGSRDNPGSSCFEILMMSQNRATTGRYWVMPNVGVPNLAVETMCDMEQDGGGWTLIGEVDGMHTMHDTWLRTSFKTENLITEDIEANTYACFDAVDMAVHRALEIRLSNSYRDIWVKWRMPTGRTLNNWWHHEIGPGTTQSLGIDPVVVIRQDGARTNCYQSLAGIMPFAEHGGSYPYTSANPDGNTSEGDDCMAVGVMQLDPGVSENGFVQDMGNGFDAPSGDHDWPNGDLGRPARLKVWLR